MDSRRLGVAWLTCGLMWFLLGITWSPTSKLYQQGLILLYWLPALWLSWQLRECLVRLWQQEKRFLIIIVALFGWAAISACWSVADDPAREVKRLIYILLFLLGLTALGAVSAHLPRVFQWAGLGLALAALVALVQHYGLNARPWHWRAEGLGQLDHPIIGGYVFGVALIWSFSLPLERMWVRLIWAGGLLTLLSFIILSQSRGLWIALLACVLLRPFWQPGRASVIAAVALLFIGVVGYWQFGHYVIARGTSYRPEIFGAGWELVMQRPWLGLGLGSDYWVEALGRQFGHVHNLFLHVAVELGLPGLMLWLTVWGHCFLAAFQERSTRLGGALLGMLMFSTVALLFDGSGLWDTPRPEWFLTWLPVGLALAVRAAAVTRPGQVEL